jgi:hypothetical protein
MNAIASLRIKPPPLLMGVALLFWGWMAGFLIPAAIMALILEGSHLVRVRWEFSDTDFRRIWIFCTLLFLSAAVYAFTANEGPTEIRSLVQNPNFFTQRNAGAASARTAAALIRWLPMIFFLFVAAQTYSSREAIPLQTISLILSRRWKRAKKAGEPLPPEQFVNVSYLFFVLCLFAAGIRASQDSTYFWGIAVLTAWALWSIRSIRFGILVWGIALGLAVTGGYYGQGSVTRLQRYLEGLNAHWLSGLGRRGSDPTQTRTQIGQIGRIKTSGKIVIRLEPKPGSGPPTLLREASYRGYRSPVWHAGSSKSDFETIASETNGTTWVLLPNKASSAEVNISCYLDGGTALLPLPEGSSRLEKLPAYILKKNSAGAVLAEGPGLVMFDALYGPGASIDSAPTTNDDLALPLSEEAVLDQVISELQLEGRSQEEVLRKVGAFFASQFTYSMWQEHRVRGVTNLTPLAYFLTQSRSGHCEYFATATVLLLRRLDIPARYAVGYAVHEMSGKKYVVRARDAHAWCIVWDKQKQVWKDFDTTPASWVEEESKAGSPFQFLSDAWSRLVFEFSKIRWGQTPIREYLLWSLIPVLGILLYQIFFRARRHRKGAKPDARPEEVWPGLDSEFYQVEQRLSAHGIERQAGEPLSAWLMRAAATPGLVELREPLGKLLWLHYRYRFDPQGLGEPERQALRTDAQRCLAQLKTARGSVS